MIIMKKIIYAIILLSFILSIYFYAVMPEQMASHWNAQGNVDGYMPKFWGLFLMPFVLLGLLLLFNVIPKIDPLDNIKKFKKYYDGFIIVMSIFMLFIHVQIILWNLGYMISPNYYIPVSIGLLFFYIGVLCENSKRNWFVGIRTPWTLSSDKVWDKTHKLGGKLFKIAGIIALIGIFFQNYVVYFILIPTFSVSIYLIVYSYVEFRKEKK